MKTVAKLLACAALVGLAGCGPIVSFGDGEPETVYTLRTDTMPLGETDGPFLFIAIPSFAEGLGGRRVSVMLSDYERSSLKNVRWTTGSGDLIRDYLVASLRNSTGARTLGEDGLDVTTRCRLNTYVWSMDFVPGPDDSEDYVTMRVEASLIDLIDGILLARKVFEERRKVGKGALPIMGGFNDAMKDISDDMGAWLNDSERLAICNNLPKPL